MKNKPIRVGNQTSFMAAAPLDPFLFAVKNGFDAFEWFPDKKGPGAGWEAGDISAETRRDIKKTALDRDILLSVHAPWWADPLQPETDELFSEHIIFAGDIGATLLNIHLNLDAGLESYARAVTPLIHQCREAGLRLSIENTPLTGPEDFNRLFTLLNKSQDIGRAHVGMCFDLGHANLYAGTRNDYIGFLERLAPRTPIIHVHLHENFGDHDSHLLIFTGPAGRNDLGIRTFLDRLTGRAYEGAVILEQWPEPPAALCPARDRLIRLLSGTIKDRESPAAEVKKKRPDKKQKKDRPPANPFVEKLITSDHSGRSWREKLAGIRALLFDEALSPADEDLVYLAIYLRFLGTGEIVCAEDGRHFRPSHHARISQDIQERLAALSPPADPLIMRRIYPWLPSFDSAFTRAEPLTRIRDIAHRNDIPQALKKEIKHSLQNKLHRCAGPEDLVVCEDILQRITAADGEYSAAFVEQFKIFHEELREFFNAVSLEKGLERIDDRALLPHIKKFLSARRNIRNNHDRLAALLLLTGLRARLAKEIDLKADAGMQNMRLADIGLENYAFVLLSEMINALENRGHPPWKDTLQAMIVLVDNLHLSGIEAVESGIIAAELRAWRTGFNSAAVDHLLRLKATLTRCRRLAEGYSRMINTVFFDKAQNLGRALGVAEHAIDLYCEGEIRGNLTFQLSRLVDLLLLKIRETAGLSPWDVLVPGAAVGRVRFAASLADPPRAAAGKTILLAGGAEGDETIPDEVSAVILVHHIPHLSHLAIRARQQGVILAAADDAASFSQIRQRTGEHCELRATPDAVVCRPVPAGISYKKTARPVKVHIPHAEPAAAPPATLELSRAEARNSGAKADGARRLQELSQKKDAGFRTPESLVIPFGVMEASMDADPLLKKRYLWLRRRLAALTDDDFARAADDLARMITDLRVPAPVMRAIMKTFGPVDGLMVRSSASCEDLAGAAGAGLYESVANVAPAGVEEAVRRVWASLWTRRAAVSRKRTGIRHENAFMAVLVQRMIIPDYSFIMHTVNPVTGGKDEIYIELAVGLGETLASGGTIGTPYRMVCDKKTGRTAMTAFADIDHARRPDKQAGMISEPVNYADIPLSRNKKLRTGLGRRLAGVGRLVEENFLSPQDIEGAVAGDEIWLVQSRPQIMANPDRFSHEHKT